MKQLVIRILFVTALASMLCARVLAIEPAVGEMSAVQNWTKATFGSGTSGLPFTFRYDGKASTDILEKWGVQKSVSTLDRYREQQTIVYKDPATHLEVRCVMVHYKDFPTVEWTLYFKNAGNVPTPILEDIKALDIHIENDGKREFQLHYSKGSSAKSVDFQPLETSLSAKSDVSFSPVGGRSTDGAFPYFNLEQAGHGIILAVGWPGQWSTRFVRDQGATIRVLAGQETTHFKLLPNEEVRSPLIAMQFYQGDWIDAQNNWRRWMIAHNTPRPGGQLPVPLLAGGTCPFFGPFIGNNEENQKLFIRRYQEEGLKLDYWWIDAGWYPNDGKWTNTGTWEVDAKRFPRGIRAVADYAHAKGTKLIVWFEPERVTPGTELYEHHPEWLLSVAANPNFPPSQKGWKLLNLGNPVARKWVTDHVDKMITEQHIDLYRQDFNMEALPYWRANDAKDRQGITENQYVTGYLSYWDELRRRHPKMLIDNCASGGRRLDLESLRRSVPLWRSDYIIEPVGMQNQTYGISLWFPYEGLASQIAETGKEKKSIDTYAFRSDMYSSIHAHWDVRRTDIDYARLRELVSQWRTVAPNYTGNYYPLTTYDSSDKAWMAWQFDRPETGAGVVQVFRRPNSSSSSLQVKLRGLDPQAKYTVTNIDTSDKKVATGQDLMNKGVLSELRESPGSSILTYKKTVTNSSSKSGASTSARLGH
jgi:alpha-galactosidase